MQYSLKYIGRQKENNKCFLIKSTVRQRYVLRHNFNRAIEHIIHHLKLLICLFIVYFCVICELYVPSVL